MDREYAKAKISKLVGDFFSRERQGGLSGMSEEDTKRTFIEPLFEALGWDVRNPEEVWENRSQAHGKRPDYAFRMEGVVRFFLEAKAVDAELAEKEAWQAINYAYMQSVPWAALTNFRELLVYNANWKSKRSEDSRFLRFEAADYVNSFDDLWLLSKESALAGEMERKAQKYGKLTREPVTKALYADLTRWRSMISKSVLRNDPRKKWTKELLDEAVQRYLNRLIFMRTCEDRRIENEQLRAALRQWREENKRKLRIYINNVMHDGFVETYDSDIFFAHMAGEIPVEDEVLAQVIDELYESPSGAQYNFDAINADILGNIYEQYLATVLRGGGSLVEREGKRKEMGIYYTPTYIVDYIVKNTLGQLVAKCKTVEDLQKIRILDPACGSGSFLIRAFEVLREEYAKKNGGDHLLLTENISKNANDILTKNIYGVDLDIKAIEIVYLNLLLRAAVRRGLLPMLSDNIKRGNSLISGTREELEAHFGPHWREKHPFNWGEEFKEVMDGGGFDVVIGNPPWVQSKFMDEDDKEFFAEKYEVAKKQYDLFSLFIERGLEELHNGGIVGFIVPDRFLTNLDYDVFRRFVLETSKILRIVHLGDGVFEGVSMPSAIIIIQKEKSESERNRNIVKYARLGGGENLETLKYENRAQADFYKEEDCIFPIFYDKKAEDILEKIRHETKELAELVDNARGVEIGKGSPLVADKKMDERYVKFLLGEDIGRYEIRSHHYLRLNAQNVDYKEPSLYKGTKILIRKTGTGINAVIDETNAYIIQVIYIFKKRGGSVDERYLLGLLNSKLISYYYFSIFGEKERTTFPHLTQGKVLKLPIRLASSSDQQPIIKLVEQMLDLNKKLVQMGELKTTERQRLEEEIRRTDSQIDGLVYKLYGITDEEKKTIEESFKK